mmetsp:Transcript_583/g.1834  ORF Transcript_583/g.1834 Transcript_583/m.1834 type:complete len:93 (+) Transcript_583:115-393(+)
MSHNLSLARGRAWGRELLSVPPSQKWCPALKRCCRMASLPTSRVAKRRRCLPAQHPAGTATSVHSIRPAQGEPMEPNVARAGHESMGPSLPG